MDLISLKYWHWMVLGLLAGGLIGWAWTGMEPAMPRSGDAEQFKARVGQTSTSDVNNGRPLVYDIVVMAPETDPMDQLVYPVTYKLLGTDAKTRKTPVYQPQSLYAKPAFDGGDSIVAFLRKKNVSFSDRTGTGKYLPVGYGLATGAVFIGLIWPTMIRLLVGAGFAAPKPVEEKRYATGDQNDGTVKDKKRGGIGGFFGGGGKGVDPLAPKPVDEGGSIDGLFASTTAPPRGPVGSGRPDRGGEKAVRRRVLPGRQTGREEGRVTFRNPAVLGNSGLMKDRGHLLTELRNPDSMALDAIDVEAAVAVMNKHDRVACDAVEAIRADVARAVTLVAGQLGRGGRLIYFGAGTSGRLGVLDASECPPTFRSDPRLVEGVIAGGMDAMFKAKEGAEDSTPGGAKDVDDRDVGPNDVVMGIASGGTTPYVWGALNRAIERGAKTIFLSCVQPVEGEPKVDVILRPLTGPEVLTGSTRLKAGTATKLILNQITTLAMVQLGKVYENLMVDVKASNVKLVDRSIRIIAMLAEVDRDRAAELLEASGGHVKLAIVMQKRNVDAAAAQARLDATNGRLRAAIAPN